MYACLYRPPALDAYNDQRRARGDRRELFVQDSASSAVSALNVVALARDFSPRYERHRDDLVSIDVSGLGRLLGPARAIGEQLQREAAARGLRVHVALAGTRMAALVLVHARPGLRLVERGEEAEALAPLPIGILEKIAPEAESLRSRPRECEALPATPGGAPARVNRSGAPREVRNVSGLLELPELSVFRSWGLKTLGELAALPPADLAARLGPTGLVWQAIARGDDVRPLVPDVPEERFESSIELEWPIDGLEPLSFVLTRLLEPLSTRLERRDRGAAVLHVRLGLVTHDTCTRSLQLPSPIRDVRTLRTLALLDLESHPPPAAIDRVTIVIDPTPGRVLQHTLFARAHPTPEQLSTLLARLGALMGQDRIGAPALVDSYRPGAFVMRPFPTTHTQPTPEAENLGSTLRQAQGRPEQSRGARPRECEALPARAPGGAPARVKDVGPHARQENISGVDSTSPNADMRIPQALRRCRHPVPARVAVVDGQPVRVTTDRRGFVGGQVLTRAGPWRTSGEWWLPGRSGESGRSGRPGESGRSGRLGRSGEENAAHRAHQTSPTHLAHPTHQSHQTAWNRDEWDVALSDGAVYRIFRDRETNGWFIDAIVD